jgi:hypothetical protein
MKEYKLKVEKDTLEDIPQTPFCFKTNECTCIVFRESGSRDTFWICGLDSGLCSSWGKDKIIENLNNKFWKLLESKIIFE